MLHRIKKFVMRITDRRPKVFCQVAVLPQNEMLKGRCALITGGTSGIGYSIAEAYLKAGASVIITGRNQERLDKACAKLSTLGNAHGYVMDNTHIKSFDSILDCMMKECNSMIDILVNNAGVQGANYPDAQEESYDIVLDTNLKASYFLCQTMANIWVKQGVKGNILNVCSSSSLRPAISAYTLSKWGLKGLTLGLAKSLIKHGIVVNGIAPGATATPMLNKTGDSEMTYSPSPMGRLILPEEIANMAVFLVSNMGRSIVGDIIYMTGGMGVITIDDINYDVFKK